MKYELIKKILNSPITILDYLILEHIQNNTTDIFLKDISFIKHFELLKLQEFVSNNNRFKVKVTKSY